MMIAVFEGNKNIPCMLQLKRYTGLTMPTLSNNLKILINDKIILRKKKGRKVLYSLTAKGKRWVEALQKADTEYQIFGGKANEKSKR